MAQAQKDSNMAGKFINAINKGKKKEKEKAREKLKAKEKPPGHEKDQKRAKPSKIREISPTNSITFDGLNETDMITLKMMIDRFKLGQLNVVPVENLELIELKHALRHFGIDFKTILEHYRKLAVK